MIGPAYDPYRYRRRPNRRRIDWWGILLVGILPLAVMLIVGVVQ